MKVFVDTNILIDLVCSREDFIQDAQDLFKAAFEDKIEIAISAISFINTLYIGHRYDFLIDDLVNSLQGVQSFCEVTSIDSAVIYKMLDCDWKDKEDFAQYASAIASNCDAIVTRNKDDYKKSEIPVYSVKELLDCL